MGYGLKHVFLNDHIQNGQLSKGACISLMQKYGIDCNSDTNNSQSKKNKDRISLLKSTLLCYTIECKILFVSKKCIKIYLLHN